MKISISIPMFAAAVFLVGCDASKLDEAKTKLKDSMKNVADAATEQALVEVDKAHEKAKAAIEKNVGTVTELKEEAEKAADAAAAKLGSAKESVEDAKARFNKAAEEVKEIIATPAEKPNEKPVEQ